MDSQEGIDEVYTLDYFDRTKIDGDINSQSKKRSRTQSPAGISFKMSTPLVKKPPPTIF